MIAASIKEWSFHSDLRKIPEVFSVLEMLDFSSLSDGRFEVEGGKGIFYLVQHYSTMPLGQCALEAHKDFVDLQFIAEGEECIGYLPIASNPIVKEQYNPEKDIVFFQTSLSTSFLNLSQGMFAVFFPEDAHLLKLQTNGPSKVTKIVFKIPLKAFAE